MAGPKPKRPAVGPRFEIWQVGGRIHSIDNPVRIEILSALETKPRTLRDLVSLTRKAKSTLSAVHLSPLLEGGLVTEAIDPKDARVKWYTLAGSRLGASSVEKPLLRDAVLHYVQSTGIIPLGPLLDVLSVRDLLESGASAAFVEGVARRLGSVIGRMLTSSDPRDAGRELNALLEAAGLDGVEWRGGEVRLGARPSSADRFVKVLAEAAMAARSVKR